MRAALAALLILMTGCARNMASFRVTAPEATPMLAAPDRKPPVPFSDLLARQYDLNYRDGYVDLFSDMALRIQVAQGLATDEARYQMKSGSHLALVGKATDGPAAGFLRSGTRAARRWRFYYAVKFVKAPGQPYHPAFVVWGDSNQALLQHASVAEQDPATVCQDIRASCVAFAGKSSVSPEVLVQVQAQPRFVLLGSTVQDLLRADRIQNQPSTLRVIRRYRNQLAPVVWEQEGDVMRLPLTAGDRVSW